MLIRKIIQTVKGKSKRDAFYGFLVGLMNQKPKDRALYEMAFRHKSASLYEGGEKLNNERLEYLGDAILDAIIADWLFQKFPKQKEGFLTKLRSKLVSRKTLNKIGIAMQLERFLKHNGVLADNVCGNCLEAFIGAIYLDFGYEKAKAIVIARFFEMYVDLQELITHDENFKSKLVEFVQHQKQHLTFQSQEKEKNGRPFFFAEAIVDGTACGSGSGVSKKQAEQAAASAALQALGR